VGGSSISAQDSTLSIQYSVLKRRGDPDEYPGK
jgi:hypothetical protein